MKALVVVDMQQDFVEGALGSPQAQAIVEGIVSKIKASRTNGDLIYFTLDTHDKNYLETEEGKNLPVPHCMKGTLGHRLMPQIEELTSGSDIMIEKSGFASPQLAKSIAGKGSEIEEVELVGLCTDICIISNAMVIKAYSPETPISVVSSLCAGATPKGHENALQAMKTAQIHIK